MQLTDKTLSTVLKEFGMGQGMPGSGCVAALSAISAAELLASVCKLTLDKKSYHAVYNEVSTILLALEQNYIPKLNALMQGDIELVDEMFRLRALRDNEQDPEQKEAYRKQASAQLRKATTSTIQLCDTSLQLLPHAIYIYDNGLKSARGDTGVVICNLAGTASGALYMSLLNLKAGKNAEWVKQERATLDPLLKQYGKYNEYINASIKQLIAIKS